VPGAGYRNVAHATPRGRRRASRRGSKEWGDAADGILEVLDAAGIEELLLRWFGPLAIGDTEPVIGSASAAPSAPTGHRLRAR
jgi:hypothetical protein